MPHQSLENISPNAALADDAPGTHCRWNSGLVRQAGQVRAVSLIPMSINIRITYFFFPYDLATWKLCPPLRHSPTRSSTSAVTCGPWTTATWSGCCHCYPETTPRGWTLMASRSTGETTTNRTPRALRWSWWGRTIAGSRRWRRTELERLCACFVYDRLKLFDYFFIFIHYNFFLHSICLQHDNKTTKLIKLCPTFQTTNIYCCYISLSK